ncbi:MAG: hypothetical protein DSY94_01420 [SAR324 cluster bacterium]|uniref:Bacterial bifunctional deaminase-reductase C-terminal domain-containing protein n=1 Tax=SAR324 cluster bacterium TaxID=2024889 RepID=A0A432GSU3_9DELT|nr:MAG: hypothetical protein DSY94_01420 [SAR324 cluster bacterium]
MTKNSGIIVTLKAAATLDGKIGTATGHSKWITGEAARQKGHELRNENDAVLVGINTVLADDPELTVRGIDGGRSPVRIVLDSKGRIPEQICPHDADGALKVASCSAPTSASVRLSIPGSFTSARHTSTSATRRSFTPSTSPAAPSRALPWAGSPAPRPST